MQQMFADYQPDNHGDPLGIDIRPFETRDIDQCVTLAVERNGGDRSTWHSSFEQNLTREDRQSFVAVHRGHVVDYGTTSWLGLSEHDGARNVADG